MLNNKELRELISATQQNINLREAAIEKDYYVTQIIHAISGLENEYFKLIFCGGTCLAKAHKIISRMSEDIDFKIQITQDLSNWSKTRFLKELKAFRAYIQSQLIFSGITAKDPIVRNEGQYFKIELDYPSVFPHEKALRPDILLEFTLSDIYLSTTNLLIRTLIEDNLNDVTISSSNETCCISITETAVEKWVGLTRRIIAIDRGYHKDDKTLIRHVYDLYVIKQANKINTDFFELANTVILNDANQFKNQHPEYFTDFNAEIQQSITILKNNSLWKERYEEFIETMIYDHSSVPVYDLAIENIENIKLSVTSHL